MTMSKTVIHKATRDDLETIAEFLDECWRFSYRDIITDESLDKMQVPERHRRLLERYDAAASDFLMMLDGDLLIGVAAFGEPTIEGYKDDGEVTAIYLQKDYIGRGYGHFLLTEIEQALAAKGYADYVLDVLQANTQAIRFYQAHGYEKVAESTFTLGDTEYPLDVMRKSKT